MSALGEDLEYLAFEAPYLGMPPGYVASARETDRDGRFVEIFLNVRGDTVTQAGFLTDIPVVGVLCASIWCGLATGASVHTARAITSHDILSKFPRDYPPPMAAAEVCIRAGLAAIACRKPNPM